MARAILHVDMDEFFAAVEKLDNPALRGKPLLVGGDPKGRGVVATASYEARAFGCHSAMPTARALQLCPQAILLPPHFHRYEALSGQVFEIFRRFTPLVEGLSIDEAFLDVTDSQRLCGPGPLIAAEIKRLIRQETQLTASVGVAANKFLAKLASDLKKPDGLVVVPDDPQAIRALLDPLPVRKLWGVGPAAEKQLARLNVRTVGELRRCSFDLLRQHMGLLSAEHLSRLSRGEDDRPVEPGGQAKSIGQETTFPTDLADADGLRRVLLSQVEEVAGRLRSQQLLARTVTLKIRYGDFTTLTRSHTLAEPTDQTQQLWDTARDLFDTWASASFRPLRLLGMHVSGLGGRAGLQRGLFDEPAGESRQSKLDQALDNINGKFGKGSVRRGRTDD